MRMADAGGGSSAYTRRLAGLAGTATPVNPLTGVAVPQTNHPLYPSPGTASRYPQSITETGYRRQPLPYPKKRVAPASAPAQVPMPNATGQFSMQSFDTGLGGELPAPPPPIKYGFNSAAGEVDPTAGDELFASTQGHLQRTLAQFLASQQREAGLIESNAAEQTEGLERQKGIDLVELLENFAGRGTAYSGRYIDDDRELGNAYARRLLAVKQGVGNQKASQAERKADFEEDQRLALEQARAQSLARRLEAQGLV